MSNTSEIVNSVFDWRSTGKIIMDFWESMEEEVSEEWKLKFNSVINEMNTKNRKLISYCRSCTRFIMTGYDDHKSGRWGDPSGCGCDYMYEPDEYEMRRRIHKEYILKTKFNSDDINDGVILLSENNSLNLEWSKQYKCIISTDCKYNDNVYYRNEFNDRVTGEILDKLLISHRYNTFILKYFTVIWRNDVKKALESTFIEFLKGEYIPKTEDEKMIDYCLEKFWVFIPKTDDERMIDYCMEHFYQ